MRYRLLVSLWLIADLALFVASYAAAYFLRVGFILSSDFPFERFLATTVWTAPTIVVLLMITRSYGLTRNQMTLRNAAYIGFGALVSVALFTLLYYFRFSAFFSRLLLVYAFAFSATALWLWHIVFGRLLRTALHRGREFPTLIVGVTRESMGLVEELNARRSPLTPVAVLDGKGAKEEEIDGVPILGKLNKLNEVIESHRITHLIQCSDLEQSQNLISICREKGLTYLLLPSVLGIVEHDERIESLEGHPVTVVSPDQGMLGWFFR